MKENWNDKEFVLNKIKEDEYNLEYASEELKADKEVVLEAVKKDGICLEYASEELKNDKEVVLIALKTGNVSNFALLEYAGKDLKADKDVALAGLEQNKYDSMEYVDEKLLNDKEFLKQALDLDVSIEEYISEELKNDKEFILHAIEVRGWAIDCASEQVRYGEGFLSEAVRRNEEVLEYIEKDANEFDEKGINKETGTEYNKYGYNEKGYDRNGYDVEGYDTDRHDKDGFNHWGLNEDLYDRKGNGGIELFEKLITDKNIDMEEYIKNEFPDPLALEESLKYSHKYYSYELEDDEEKTLKSNQLKYKKYRQPFDKEEYLGEIEENNIKYGKGDILVSPREEDIDKCIEYLKENNRMISYATVRNTIKDYLLGNIDITKPIQKHSIEEVEETISGTKLSDLNKASSEIVQANEEKEQEKTNKTEHDEP